jgi:histidinol phosphatase-like enzyme
MNKAVFLDRDGVINRAIVREGKPYPPLSLEELEILPGVREALKKLHDYNYWSHQASETHAEHHVGSGYRRRLL